MPECVVVKFSQETHNMHNIVLLITRLFYSSNFEDMYGQI
jgi:hypothetical protein